MRHERGDDVNLILFGDLEDRYVGSPTVRDDEQDVSWTMWEGYVYWYVIILLTGGEGDKSWRVTETTLRTISSLLRTSYGRVTTRVTMSDRLGDRTQRLWRERGGNTVTVRDNNPTFPTKHSHTTLIQVAWEQGHSHSLQHECHCMDSIKWVL